MSQSLPRVISTEWLAGALGSPDLVVLDGSLYLPEAKRDPRGDYRKGHIPGAVFFPIDEIRDHANPVPVMMPSAAEFAAKVGALGVSSNDRIVVYDGAPFFSAPRVAWMFRVMGHDAIAVLDGGFPKWCAEKRPVETGEAKRSPAVFKARYRPELVRSFEDMRRNLESQAFQVADSRGPGRFSGREPEPRPGMRSGHIPGAVNVYYNSLLRPDGTILAPAELQKIFAAAKLNLNKPIVTSCGGGVTACALLLGLERTGARDVAVYDGSWSEWGARQDVPIETG